MRGTFIVVDGRDGVGKTTLARCLVRRLEAAGLEVVEVREPGGTPLAEAARAAVLDPSLEAVPAAELFLILAARADLVARVIEPALRTGKVVVADRFDLSTEAYQVAGRGLAADAVTVANRLATGGLIPDLTLVLDAPDHEVRERRALQGKDPDRIERADADVLGRVSRAFRDARGPGIVHLDASGTPEEVESAAWEHVQALLAGTPR